MTRPSLALLLIAGVIAGRGFYRGWLADVQIQRIKSQAEAAARAKATTGDPLIPEQAALYFWHESSTVNISPTR